MTQPTLHLSQLREPASDVDLSAFNLEMRNKAGIKLGESISAATIDQTIDGASTLVVVVEDDNARTIQNSGKLGRKVDVEVDGLFWTLVAVKKTGRQVQLTFEEREVNFLRYYNSFIVGNRANMTRAQFVLKMIKEVKEAHLKWEIPELNTYEKPSDAQPGTILVNATGVPVTVPDPASQVQEIPQGSRLTVKGQPATEEQIRNANQILQKGLEMGANRKVQVSSIMTAIDESRIINLIGGDRDSVGVFQQRRSMGWPATRDVPTDAAAYFKEAIALDAQKPSLPIQLLCQGVQRSFDATGSNYAAYQAEAEQWVTAFGTGKTSLTGEKGSGGVPIAGNNQKDPTAAGGALSNIASGNYFFRGQISTIKNSSYFRLTPETSWACMQRLAQEVGWRCFCIHGVIWFVSDKWLFKSKPALRISEDVSGIDWLDYDYDEGKRTATVTATAHISRWSTPPGTIVEIFDMGIINGKWLVSEISRSLFDTVATVTLIKPEPVLPEPTSLSPLPSSFTPPAPVGARTQGTQGATVIAPNAASAAVVAYAQSQIGVPYKWGAEIPGVGFDCSGLAQAAYSSAGIQLPRVAQAQYDAGPKLTVADKLLPGDLVFFGADLTSIEHVGIYIGDSAMIDAPHTGAFVRIDKSFMGWTDPKYVGASRPWALSKT